MLPGGETERFTDQWQSVAQQLKARPSGHDQRAGVCEGGPVQVVSVTAHADRSDVERGVVGHDWKVPHDGQYLREALREARLVGDVCGTNAVQHDVEAVEPVQLPGRPGQEVMLLRHFPVTDHYDAEGADAAAVAVRGLDVDRRKGQAHRDPRNTKGSSCGSGSEFTESPVAAFSTERFVRMSSSLSHISTSRSR